MNTDISVGSVVKFMDLVGIVTAIGEYGNKTILEVDTPKRIALHQPNTDTVEYDPALIETGSNLDLLREMHKWFSAQEDYTGIETPEVHALVVGYKDALLAIDYLQKKCYEYQTKQYASARSAIIEKSKKHNE